MLWDYEQRTAELPGVILGGSGNMGGALPDGGSSSDSSLPIHFTDFTVFNKDTTIRDEREELKFQQRFDSLTTTKADVRIGTLRQLINSSGNLPGSNRIFILT